MLTLFQNITQELTATEKETFVPMLLDTLQFTHTDNRITGKELCGWFKRCGKYVMEAVVDTMKAQLISIKQKRIA